MPRVGFQPTIPAIERAKIINVLYRAANVIGNIIIWRVENTIPQVSTNYYQPYKSTEQTFQEIYPSAFCIHSSAHYSMILRKLNMFPFHTILILMQAITSRKTLHSGL
jgi:hypothetical protein